jgi:hypothetical protein
MGWRQFDRSPFERMAYTEMYWPQNPDGARAEVWAPHRLLSSMEQLLVNNIEADPRGAVRMRRQREGHSASQCLQPFVAADIPCSTSPARTLSTATGASVRAPRTEVLSHDGRDASTLSVASVSRKRMTLGGSGSGSSTSGQSRCRSSSTMSSSWS